VRQWNEIQRKQQELLPLCELRVRQLGVEFSILGDGVIEQ
jgi:hypothetical protein